MLMTQHISCPKMYNVMPILVYGYSHRTSKLLHCLAGIILRTGNITVKVFQNIELHSEYNHELLKIITYVVYNIITYHDKIDITLWCIWQETYT